ncbi:MAG: ATP-binding cassette domain-containing protein, partial [Porphyromonadaceae bacterium]|nr:ATP-binding cassette domain-containing protein [Porphyromonadaceae bacterium]
MRIESKYNKPLIDLAEEILDENNKLRIKVNGYSMYPSFRNGDICIEEKCRIEELKIGDIVVCRRNNFLIMHRLKKLRFENGKYTIIMRGDNVVKYDSPFSEEHFVARVTDFIRDGKQYSVNNPKFKFYKFIDDFFHPISVRINHLVLRARKALPYLSSQSKSLRINIRSLIKGSEKHFRTNAVIAVLKGLIPLAMIVCIKYLIDFLTRSSLQTTEQKYIFFGLLGLTAVLFLATGLLNQIGNYFGEKMSQSITRKVYNDLHNKHIRLNLSDFENSEKLDKMHRAVQESSYRPVRILNSALGFIKTTAAGVILLGLFISIRWYLILILLVAVIPEAVARIAYVRKLYRLKEKQAADEREKFYYNRVLTGFPFAKEMRLFDFSGYFTLLFNQKQDEIFQEKLKITRYETRNSIISQTFAVLLIFLSLGIVSYLSIAGAMSIGTVVLFFFAFQRGYAIMNEFFRSVTGMIEDNTFLEDFLSFLNSPDTATLQPSEIKPFSLKNEIRFENVSFRYESSERYALRNVNINIPVGKTVALVGENGAGKSTLIKLLCGFYSPTAGKITVDGTSINEIGSKEMLANITAVFQDFALYQVAAIDNILLGDYKKQPDIRRAKQSAEISGISESLENLPFGYKTRLGHLFKESEEL